jgi:predicted PurR-regulated permease PerM
VAFLDRRTTAVVKTLFVFTLIGAFVYGARHTIVAFIFAIFFAYLIEPLVTRLERWPSVSRKSRGIAIIEVYLVLSMICAGIVFGAGPYVASEGRHLLSAAPALLDKLISGEIVRQIGSSRGWSYETQLRIQHFLALHREAILTWIQQLGLRIGTLATNGLWVVLIPILAVFFLKDAGKFAKSGVKALHLRPQSQIFVKGVLQDVNAMAAHYIRAQLVLVGLSVLAYSIVLAAAGVLYGTILGVLAGILEFIPIVGPLVGAMMILAVAFLTGFHYVWLLVLFLGSWRVIQDYFNSPRLIHRRVKLDPLAVIFAVLAGGEIAGIIGVFLSIPVAAALRIIWQRWRTYSDIARLEKGDEPTVGHRIA